MIKSNTLSVIRKSRFMHTIIGPYLRFHCNGFPISRVAQRLSSKMKLILQINISLSFSSSIHYQTKNTKINVVIHRNWRALPNLTTNEQNIHTTHSLRHPSIRLSQFLKLIACNLSCLKDRIEVFGEMANVEESRLFLHDS